MATVKEYLNPLKTTIVIPDKPDALENKAALLLKKWLQKIYQIDSGFQVVKERLININKDEILIALGRTKFSSFNSTDSLQPYSFEINKKENILSIYGETPLGTLIASGYFLDHFCDVRFYLPDDLFISVPKNHKVNLNKVISVKEVPFTRYLMSTGYRVKGAFEWAQINGLSRKDWGSHQHSMGDRFYDDSIFKMFPEIFPIINGQRYIPKSKQDQKWEPDFAEPTLVDAAVYSAIKYFKKNPTINYISFSVQDSPDYPTEGKMGDFLKRYPNTKEGKIRGYTDAYISFLNKLADSLRTALPENGISAPKTIVYIVYGNVRYLPDVKLDASILPITVVHVSETLMDSVYNPSWKPTQAGYKLNAWPKVAKRIGNHDWAEGRGFIYPRIYTNLVSRFLTSIQKNKLNFDYAHLEFYPNWALDGPKYYLMGKIYWNPRVNTDSLLSLFCKDMFGKAAKQMESYWKNLELLNASMNNDPKRNRRIGGYTTQLSLNEKELAFAAAARKNIDKAYLIAQRDIEKERIDFFSKGFKISEGFFELYNSKDVDTAKANEIKDYLKNKIAGNPMMLNMATDTNFLDGMDNLVDQIIKKKMASKTSVHK